MTEAELGQRIWILGPPGSGKSTLAGKLRDRLGLPLYELDELFWQPGWKKAAPASFLAEVAAIASMNAWIVDGQYEAAHPTLRAAADTVIVLDVSLPVAVGRVLRRSVRRLRGRASICNGNVEQPAKIIDLLLWMIRTHRSTRVVNRRLRRELAARGVRCLEGISG